MLGVTPFIVPEIELPVAAQFADEFIVTAPGLLMRPRISLAVGLLPAVEVQNREVRRVSIESH